MCSDNAIEIMLKGFWKGQGFGETGSYINLRADLYARIEIAAAKIAVNLCRLLTPCGGIFLRDRTRTKWFTFTQPVL